MNDNLTNWLSILEGILPLAVLMLVAAVLLAVLAIIVLNLLDARRLLKQRAVVIELTPPANTNKTPEATKQLFSVLHGLESSRPFLERVLRRKVVFSLEVASTREQGIRYLVRVAEGDAATFEQTLASYLPAVKLRRADDFLGGVTAHKRCRVVEFRQAGHFAYPLHTQLSLEQHDPMAYLTGTMTKLSPGELMAFQLVVTPVRIREAHIIANRLLHNEELVYKLGKHRLPAGKIFGAINSVLFGILDAVGDISSGPRRNPYNPQAAHNRQVAMKIKPARTLTPFEQQLAEAVNDKLNQPLFAVNIRALVATEDKQSERQRIKGLRDWLTSLKVPKYQALRLRRNLRGSYRVTAFKQRLPSLFRRSPNILSAAELADLYHFPHTETAKTENIIKSLSKTLPAPVSLKGKTHFDILLGRNHHHGTITDIGLTAEQRERHLYAIGGTGNGKTTMFEYAFVQDMKAGRGAAIIDPHGDMAAKMLRYVPPERINDVIYFNPSDLSYPIGLNLLELPEGVTGDKLLEAKDFVTEAVISVMRKIFSDDDSGGHRIEYVLRNATQTALTLKDATLFTIFDLLTDTKYRKKVAKTLENQKLKNFWNNEFGKAGDFQRVKMAGGVTAKIGRFQFSASAERIMSQPKSTINFEDILDGKILICNFAKGLIGEDTSQLFGVSTLAKLQLAAYKRVEKQPKDRKPFYLYVDEFQNFAMPLFMQMLSESRKYKLSLAMAEQTTSQQERDMVNTILANVGTLICFKSANPIDEEYMLPQFAPYIEKGEIANLPTYNFYAKISAGTPQEPVSGETIVLEDSGSDEIAEKVIAESRANYAIKYEPKAEPTSPEKTKNTGGNTSDDGDRPEQAE